MRRPFRLTARAFAFAMAAFMLTNLVASAADQQVVVTPDNVNDVFDVTTSNGGAISFVADAEAPLGDGAMRIQSTAFTSEVRLTTADFAGERLSDINGLSFWHKKSSTGSTVPSPTTIGFLIDVDYDNDGVADATWSFSPVGTNQGQQATVLDSWQLWLGNFAGGANWTTNVPLPGICANFCEQTWSNFISAAPNAKMVNLSITIGNGPNNFFWWNGGIDVLVDNVALALDPGGTTMWDFEEAAPASNEPVELADCQNGGWETMTRADGTGFSNQGQCVKYLRTGK